MLNTELVGEPLLHLESRRLLAEARRVVPEAFDSQGRLLSPIAGAWVRPPAWFDAISPIDGKVLAELPLLDAAQVATGVEKAAGEFIPWAAHSLEDRSRAVIAAVDLLKEHRDLLVRILAWDIGKTLPTAYNDVDRCLAGIEWYLEQMGPMLESRQPLGLVSNIASWNYPFSVLLLNVLVQTLAGNSVIAKIPTQGGGVSLTVAFALLRRAKLPVSLAGGRGRDLSESLVGHPRIAGVAFIGGRANGAEVHRRLRATDKRYALEMEGVNAYAVTSFSDWDKLGQQIRAGFDFGKQRCTAYTRWVVEQSLVPKFVRTYVDAVSALRVGNPLLGAPVDFGPLISPSKVEELRALITDAKEHGTAVLFQGELADDAFTAQQERGAYLPPTLLFGVHRDSELYLREPFGPIDVLISVDSEEELVREANVSNGALVASVATDDPDLGERIAGRLHAFKVGINKLRSRGDREESFGGKGGSWAGAFVGGTHLVRAFTDGPHPIEGNWPD
ncbi:aldehyde dehydrogenase [Myxococcus llanfairpwllgwyngyllgogerychwyrndrobwllllantysiliogogogochensis]|uniref:Aldehyde dehydrogenase n=1 Tax=Myxococcus llanfairpwllgwyngyllgogerychwyrndrobwllllantysiliogogogochensis TaxID=2590453 RepID=A0A540X9R3_9BACT|nr:aldehyde dehydrogenase family protein [Myxococcus llanfairpwllgwyngyllgogerychwyrndrobwllllantysiliogogogochensis]TQF17929.1 aldehyde dehydrogenase [Myxococcus llanfairpwllgwyngyllgogerychwyrndrobwllllantysiliogogogochensis]